MKQVAKPYKIISFLPCPIEGLGKEEGESYYERGLADPELGEYLFLAGLKEAVKMRMASGETVVRVNARLYIAVESLKNTI